MAFEFRCHTCGKLLRTGEVNAARPAACPACGERLVVPTATAAIVSGSDDVAVIDDDPPSADLLPDGMLPHRGGMILSFGLLGWTVCFFFGIPAWILGASDLRAMRDGRMDPAGEGMTRAGLYLGMGNVLLSIVIAVLVGGAFFIAAAQS